MQSILLMIGTPEIIMILAALLLFFGAKKLPELAKGLGKSKRAFEDATKEINDGIDNAVKKDEETKKGN